jgi:hypothetical protein
MFRVTVQEEAARLRVTIEGRLAGPWVSEMENCWRQICATGWSKPLVVDICGVTFADARGQQLLRSMHQAGAELAASGPMTTAIVEQITGAALSAPAGIREDA